MEVNVDSVRKEMVERLRDDVRKILREGKIGLVQAPVVRGNSVEVRIRESDLPRGFMALHEHLVLPFQGELMQRELCLSALPLVRFPLPAGPRWLGAIPSTQR